MIKKPKLWVYYLLYSIFPCVIVVSMSSIANIGLVSLLPGLITAIFAHVLSRSRIQNVFLSIGIISLMGYLHAFLLVGLLLGFDDLGVLSGFSTAHKMGLSYGIAALAVSVVMAYVEAYAQHKASARFRH